MCIRMGIINRKGFFEYDTLFATVIILVTIFLVLLSMQRIYTTELEKIKYAELLQEAVCFSDQLVKNSHNGLAFFNSSFRHTQENLITHKNLSNLPKNLCLVMLADKTLFAKDCKKPCASLERLVFDSTDKKVKKLVVKFCEE